MTSGLFSARVLVFILWIVDELGDMVLTKRHEGLVCVGDIHMLCHDASSVEVLYTIDLKLCRLRIDVSSMFVEKRLWKDCWVFVKRWN
jgi:hypothetical protein